GGSIVAGGAAVFLFGGIGTIGGVVGGMLSDRVGRRRMVALSLVLGTPLLLGFIHTQGAWAYALLAGGGVALYLSAAVTIVMAQELLPHRASVATRPPSTVRGGARTFAPRRLASLNTTSRSAT